MIKIENILFDTPEYESYSENEVVLTEEEMIELGIEIRRSCCGKSGGCPMKSGKSSMNCGGCPNKSNGCGMGDNGCNCRKKCCKNK